MNGRKGANQLLRSAPWQLPSETWVETVLNFGRWFHRASGRVDNLAAEASRHGRRWLQGLGHCRVAFCASQG
jgi:hypothetical protein